MYVNDLIALFDPAVLASMEAIPVARCHFIDVAIGTTGAIIKCYLGGAARVIE